MGLSGFDIDANRTWEHRRDLHILFRDFGEVPRVAGCVFGCQSFCGMAGARIALSRRVPLADWWSGPAGCPSRAGGAPNTQWLTYNGCGQRIQ